MAIYYPAGAFTDEYLSKPIIFEQHYSGTAIAMSSQSGFSPAALTNELTYERWRAGVLPGAFALDFGINRTVNYCAIAAHTLAGKKIFIHYALDGAASESSIIEALPVLNNEPLIYIFPNTSARYWSVHIYSNTDSNIPSVGVVFFGSYLQMQQRIEVGISPISLSRKTIYSGNTSEGGNWLGRSVKRTGKAGQIPLKMMPRNWYQSTLDPALQRMRYKPFFFASCPKLMPWDVSYCWLTDDPKPVTVGGMLMDVTLNVEAHAHE